MRRVEPINMIDVAFTFSVVVFVGAAVGYAIAKSVVFVAEVVAPASGS